jgi:mRNA interferase MazF
LRQGSVWLVSLDPVRGRKIAKTRPCVIASPTATNEKIATVVIVPLTSRSRPWPFRPVSSFQGVVGDMAIDQIRSVDKQWLLKHIGHLNASDCNDLVEGLATFFAKD